jgi:tetratricopeptide (TPR) repeat protein
MVGRRPELGQLEHAFERAIRDRSCQLVTVLGAAGIGKSRLARELRSLVEERATVLEGRCLPYGEGITFWPLREMVEQLVGRGGARAIAALIAGEDEVELIAERVAGATGGTAGGSAGEATFWAARRLFEALGRKRPLVLIVDDLQWAEATFLDLVEHLAVRARAAPILLVGLARTELLERRAEWGGGVTNAISVLLEPLTDPESEELLLELPEGAALSAAERARLVAASEGNPLFAEQLIQMLRDGVELEEWPPPTIHALLAARVDRLQREERDVLSVAAVIGKEFWREAVAALLPEADPSDIEQSLEGLVRKELIRPAHSGIPATEAFRFRHLLIRDAAYRSLPKEARVELHERFAEWLKHAAGEQAPEEILGYHLESAFRYAVELGAVDDHARALAARAAAELATAGRRAYARADMPAATALLARAADLPTGDAARLPVLADLADALREEGELARASSVLDGLAAAAARAGDAATQAYARMVGFRVRMQTVAGFGTGELVEACAEAISLYERTGDEGRLARAWFFLAQVPWYECHAAEAEKALERATLYARRAGDERALAWSLNLLLASHLFGPRPVGEGVAFCRDLVARRGVQRRIEASAYRTLAGLRAMAGDFAAAERLIDRDKSLLEDLGLRVIAGVAAEVYGTVWLLAGEAKRAEHELRTGSEALERLGEKSVLSNVLGLLARAVYEQGRYDEALELSARSEGVAALDDLSARAHWTGPRALVLARRGDPAALLLARAAADDASRADLLPLRGQALLDLAEVLKLSGREAEARSALEEAIAVFERKGSRAGVERARSLQAIGAH